MCAGTKVYKPVKDSYPTRRHIQGRTTRHPASACSSSARISANSKNKSPEKLTLDGWNALKHGWWMQFADVQNPANYAMHICLVKVSERAEGVETILHDEGRFTGAPFLISGWLTHDGITCPDSEACRQVWLSEAVKRSLQQTEPSLRFHLMNRETPFIP